MKPLYVSLTKKLTIIIKAYSKTSEKFICFKIKKTNR